jgi:hypothetical protein
MDGGSCDARLAFNQGELVAVFTRVQPGSEKHGWFREAGFGPCSDLFAPPPGTFSDLCEAELWLRERLAARRVR